VAAFLGDDRLRGGEEREAPRLLQAADPGVDLVVVEPALGGDGVGRFRELHLAALRERALLMDVDDHRADFLLGNGDAPRRHAFFGKTVADALGETLVVAARGPDVVEHRRGLGALEIFSVAGGAEGGVALGDGAGADGLGGGEAGSDKARKRGRDEEEAMGAHRSA
jgi:hypothetical protein